MRLQELLENQNDEAVFELAKELLEPNESGSIEECRANLVDALRSPHYLRTKLLNARPPCFWILQTALDHGGRIEVNQLKERAMSATRDIAARVNSNELAGAAFGRDLYRRILVEAWRSDSRLDDSEIFLLAVLRQELKLSNADHFLIEHHSDLHRFWDTEFAFLDVVNSLRRYGIIYSEGNELIIPVDIQPVVSQVLGIEAGPESCGRLYELLSATELETALNAAQLKSSGTRADKIQRLTNAVVSPSDVLGALQLPRLKAVATAAKVKTIGTKDQIIDRLIIHFGTNEDLRPPEEEPPAPPAEERFLDKEGFFLAFQALRAQELSDILASIGSRRVTGSKEQLITLLHESRFSEESLLKKLESKLLDVLLKTSSLKLSGNKQERIQRYLEWCAQCKEGVVAPDSEASNTEGVKISPEDDSTESSDVSFKDNVAFRPEAGEVPPEETPKLEDRVTIEWNPFER